MKFSLGDPFPPLETFQGFSKKRFEGWCFFLRRFAPPKSWMGDSVIDPSNVKPPRLFPHSWEHPSPTKRHVPSKPVHFCQTNFPNIRERQKCKFPKSWSFDGFMFGNIVERIGQSCWKKAEMHISKFWRTRFGQTCWKKTHRKDRPSKLSQSTSNLRFATVGCFGKKVNQNNFEPNGGEIHGTIRKKTTPCINKFKKMFDYQALNKWQLCGRWGLSIWQLFWQGEGLSEGAWGFKDLREITKKHHWDVLLVLSK